MSVYELRHAYHGLIGHRIADYRKWLFDHYGESLKKAAQDMTRQVRSVLGRFYERPTVDEFVRTRFDRDIEVGDEMLALRKRSSFI